MTDNSVMTVVMFIQIILSKVYGILHIRQDDVSERRQETTVWIVNLFCS